MVFQYPSVLFLMPIALLPLIWHWWRQKSTISQNLELPSLFFIDQIKKKYLYQTKIQHWLELLLEILFILILVIYMANPQSKMLLSSSSKQFNSLNKMIIFIDNTPSMDFVLKDKKSSFYEKIKQTLNQVKKLSFDQYYFITVNNIKEQNPPELIENPEYALDQINQLRFEYSDFKINEIMLYLDTYIPSWRNNANILMITDLKNNHYSKEDFLWEKAHIITPLETKTIPHFEILFTNEYLKFSQQSIQQKVNLIFPDSIKKANFSIYQISPFYSKNGTNQDKLDSHSLIYQQFWNQNDSTEFSFDLSFNSDGFHFFYYKLNYKLQGIESSYHYLQAIFVSSPISLVVFSDNSYEKESKLIDIMTKEDQNKGFIHYHWHTNNSLKLDSYFKGKDTKLMVIGLSYPNVESFTQLIKSEHGIYFLTDNLNIPSIDTTIYYHLEWPWHAVDRKKLINQNLQFIHRSFSPIFENIFFPKTTTFNIDNSDLVLFEPLKSIQFDLDSISSIKDNSKVSIQGYWRDKKNQINTPFFFTSQNKTVLFPFDSRIEFSKFWTSSFSLPLFYQSLLYLSLSQEIIYQKKTGVKQSYQTLFSVPDSRMGIFSNKTSILIQNIPTIELASPKVEFDDINLGFQVKLI